MTKFFRQRLLVISCFVWFCALLLQAQTRLLPEQFCENPLPACDLRQTIPYTAPVVTTPFPGSCLKVMRNYVWYKITIQADGRLGFLITPLGALDYDWILFKTGTPTNCNALQIVSCNYFPSNGSTGATENNDVNAQDDIGASAFNGKIRVRQGEEYLLLISRFRNQEVGYSLDFNASEPRTVVAQSAPPNFTQVDVSQSGCAVSSLVVRLSDVVACSSVQPENFVFVGANSTHRITAASAETCSSGQPYTRQFSLTLSPPVQQSGNYALSISGALSGLCGAVMQPSTTVSVSLRPFVVEISGARTFCGANGTTLSAPAGFASYRWRNTTTGQMLGQSANQAISTPGNYEVSVTDRSGCIAASQATVSIASNLVVRISGVNTFCEGDCAYMIADEGFTTYTWFRNGTRLEASRRDLCVREAGRYVVRANLNGCEAVSQEFEIQPARPSPAQPVVVRRGNALTVQNPLSAPAVYYWQEVNAANERSAPLNFGSTTFTPQRNGRFIAVVDNNGGSGCRTESEIIVFQRVDASAMLGVGTVSAEQNRTVQIPIILRSASNLAQAGVDTVSCVLRFNGRLLKPEDPRITDNLLAGERRLQLRIPLRTGTTTPAIGDTLARYTFRAMLGNTSATVLSLENLQTLPVNGAAELTATTGTFRLENIASGDGMRLITSATLRLVGVMPNPASSTVQTEYALAEATPLTITLRDALGRVVSTQHFERTSEQASAGHHTVTFDMQHVPIGIYFLILQTPATVLSTQISVLR